MSMTLSDLRTELATKLGCVADKFTDPDGLNQLLTTAAADLARRKPTVVHATLTVTALQSDYASPADLHHVMGDDWGQAERAENNPWDDAYPQRLPMLMKAWVSGSQVLRLLPAPTAAQVQALGSTYPYRYAIKHTLSETESETTVPDTQRDLLLLRATAEAMLQLAGRGVTTPVTLGPGGSNTPKNGTPGALAEQFDKLFLAGCAA